MIELGILEEAGAGPDRAAGTSPALYRFNPDQYAEMNSKGIRLEF